MRIALCLLLLTFSFLSRAQFTYEINQEIEVEVNGKRLIMPWSGGLNSVQINTMDLDGDSKPDLVLFDRTANKVLTFLSKNNQYSYAPEYEDLFPGEVTQWMLLRDFNCDGKKDIFTSDPFGIAVFVNSTKPGEALKWRPFNSGLPLLTKGFTSNVNLKVNESDIPVIDDIDSDGDLDILNVRFVGIGTVEYHKNLSRERTGACDSLQLERVTQTFGNFEECNCGVFAFGETCAEFNGGRTQHAGGKALLTLDLNNDGDKELLYSEENCAQVYLLENEGTAEEALMTNAVRFPAAKPINYLIFPATYLEDVDFDGLADLVSSPNIYARNFMNVDFKNSMWLYKNTGTSQIPQFTFEKTDFLQDEIIEVGDYAVPSFSDADGDGDLDFFISNYANQDFASAITFYENMGTTAQPKYKFITDNYLNFSITNFYNVKLQFADMNSDGKIDFVFTGTSPQNGITALYYVANKSDNGHDFSGQTLQSTNFTLGQNETVLIEDVNLDGRTDLLVGKSTGAIEYWRNQGPAGETNYVLENTSFLGLGTSIERQNPALAAGDLNADGKADLILADQKGFLSVYPDYRTQSTSIEPIKNLVYNPLKAEYTSKNLGGRGWPVIVNIFNTDKPSIIVGNALGGIHILKNDGGRELPEEPVIDLFPNPVAENGNFKIKADRTVSVQFLTLLGQKISEPISIPANQEYPITISGMPPGIYIARFSSNGKIVGKKFIVQ
ncbi:MAG: T9SS type A sorting domain-containing protein [Cyclobacteriaceae bacterium]|nr:T9SS type A sorting domain-containing protein [Cyclobacteriaceae bacterium]